MRAATARKPKRADMKSVSGRAPRKENSSRNGTMERTFPIANRIERKTRTAADLREYLLSALFSLLLSIMLIYYNYIKARANFIFVSICGQEKIMIVEKTEYKGQPVLILKRNENDRYPFSFGLGKARMILEAIEDIRKFVEENDSKDEKKD